MRHSLLQKLLWGILLLAALDLALLNSPFLGFDASAPAELRWRVVAATALVTLVGVGGILWFTRSLRRRIGRLRMFAEGLTAGPQQRPPEASQDELGGLAESLGRVGAQVNE